MDRYDAFISYSHARDMGVAEALQRELQTFARPWYRPRVLRVFRDNANLVASPALWGSIVAALERSSWFVLMASPEAARSPWVAQEVGWWLANRSPERLLIAWTAGELRWDPAARDFDWTVTDAVPPVLAGVFAEEPRWISLVALRGTGTTVRLGDVVAEFASPVRGVPKDELVGEHRSLRLRIRRAVAAALAVTTLLALVASVAGVVAYGQRNEARAQLRNATSRLLATSADTVGTNRMDVAQLLAVEAHRLRGDDATRQALLRAVTAEPRLVRHLQAGAPVTALAGSADRTTAVTGTADGTVLRWDVRSGERTEVGRLPGRVLSVAVDAAGTAVAAMDGSRVFRWTADGGVVPLPDVTAVRDGSGFDGTARRIAVSPSGRYVAVADSSTGDARDTVVLHDVATGAPGRSVRTAAYADNLVLPSDRELVIADEGGRWERRSLPDLRSRTTQPDALTGAHGYNATLSATGEFFGMEYSGGQVNVWRTDAEADPLTPDLVASSRGGSAVTAAVSRSGRRVAVVDGGTLYVSGVTTPSARPDSQIALSGTTATIPDGVEFFGDDDHLLMADGSALVVWDLTQPARVAQRWPIRIPWSCNACRPPQVDLSPDGTTAAVVDDRGSVVSVRRLDGGFAADAEPETEGESFTLLGWEANGQRLVLVYDGQVQFRQAKPGLPVVARWPARADDFEPAGLTSDRRGVVERRPDGRMRIRDLATGELTTAYRKPVLTVEGNDLVAIDPVHGKTRVVGSGPLVDAAAGDGRWAVQRQNGTLEVWDEAGKERSAVLQQDSSFLLTSDKSPPAVGGYLVAQQRSNQKIALTDYRTGNIIGSLSLPGNASALLTRLMFTSGGDKLITVTESETETGEGGMLIVWDLSEEAWVSAACAAAGRDLTAEEWRRYSATDPPTNLACSR